ncbi:MAG: hypothetical protein ACRD99_05555, partial [Nitrososphaera sp.]
MVDSKLLRAYAAEHSRRYGCQVRWTASCCGLTPRSISRAKLLAQVERLQIGMTYLKTVSNYEIIDLDPATDQLFPILFATGVRNRSSLGTVSVRIGGVNMETSYA